MSDDPTIGRIEFSCIHCQNGVMHTHGTALINGRDLGEALDAALLRSGRFVPDPRDEEIATLRARAERAEAERDALQFRLESAIRARNIWTGNSDVSTQLVEAMNRLESAQSTIAELEATVERLREDAGRYRILRLRVELRPTRVMSGALRDGLSIGIGRSFLDSPLPHVSPADAYEKSAELLDAAIDKARAARGDKPC